MEEQTPPELRDKIIHARCAIADTILMGSDAPPGRYQAPQGFNVSLEFTDIAEAERIFQALADGGTVTMPVQQTFWAARFGMLTDKFGVPWMVNCEAAS